MKPAGLFTFLFFLIAMLVAPIVAEELDRRTPFDGPARVVAREPKKKSGSGGSSSYDETQSGAASLARPTNAASLGGLGLMGAVVVVAAMA